MNTRGNNYKLLNHSFHYGLHYFSARIVNTWNSLPNTVVNASIVNTFKARLDKFLSHQVVKYDFTVDLTGTGSRSGFRHYKTATYKSRLPPPPSYDILHHPCDEPSKFQYFIIQRTFPLDWRLFTAPTTFSCSVDNSDANVRVSNCSLSVNVVNNNSDNVAIFVLLWLDDENPKWFLPVTFREPSKAACVRSYVTDYVPKSAAPPC